jgi:hypothetical protein
VVLIVWHEKEITQRGNHIIVALATGLCQGQQQVAAPGFGPEPIGNFRAICLQSILAWLRGRRFSVESFQVFAAESQLIDNRHTLNRAFGVFTPCLCCHKTNGFLDCQLG